MPDEILNASLEELYERAPCGFIFASPSGRLVRVNETFLEWTGFTRQAFQAGIRFQDLLTIPGKIFYENQYGPLLRMQGFVKEIAFDLVCQNGSLLPVLMNSIQRTDAADRPVLIASTIFDATDRRAYERELLLARRDAEQLAAVVTESSDAIVSTSAGGTIESWNASAARLFGYGAAEMIGRPLSDLLRLAGGSAAVADIAAEIRAGRAVRLETTGQHKDGRRIDVSVALTPHLGLVGEISMVSAIIRDVSARTALDRLQQEFLAMASHELRNPLSAIKAHAQLMRRRASYSESSVDAVITQTQRLERLIDDLLLASQIEAERFALNLAEVDLVAEIRAVTAVDETSEHVVELDLPDEPVIVWADALRIGQVYANLLGNAVKYAPAGTEVRVRVRASADEAEIAVMDHGPGIPSEVIPRLFDRFYRVSATANQARGLGLGLYISRRIVEAHQGRISVNSVLGQGSTFTVTLPRARGTAGPTPDTALGTEPQRPAGTDQHERT